MGAEVKVDWEEYGGIKMDQLPGTSTALLALAFDAMPRRIVELGTGKGGLSLLLAEACPSAQVLTVDVKLPLLGRPRPTNLRQVVGCQYQQGDVLREFLAEGPRLVLCDGGTTGDKANQMRFVDGLGVLRRSDVLMAHDFPGPKNGGPTEADEAEMLVKGYSPFMDGVFRPLAWLCLRKA